MSAVGEQRDVISDQGMSPSMVHRRALVVAYCVPPHAAVGTHRTLRLVTHMAECGWEVDILTIRPEAYLAGTPVDEELLLRLPSSANIVRTGAVRGFSTLGRRIEPLKRWIRAGRAKAVTAAPESPTGSRVGRTNGLKTLIEELCAMPDKDIGWLVPAVVGALRRFPTRPDVIYSSAPPWTGHLVAYVLASIWNRPWVADFRDPWVRSPWGRYTKPSMMRLGASLERLVIDRASAVMFTTQTARDEFAAHYGPVLAGKFHAVANGCDPAEFNAPITRQEHEPFVLLHAGSLYGGRSPVPLLKAVARLRATQRDMRRCLKIRFLGATAISEVDINRLCTDLGIDDVIEFVARVNRRESLAQMQRASALLILQANLNLAIPAKLYEYMAAGRPLLALCDEGEMADLIRRSAAGLVAAPDDETAIESALRSLIEHDRDPWPRVDQVWFDGKVRATEALSVLTSVIPAAAEVGTERFEARGGA